jgi:RimJ/RimL family protein N-acetyltransferase
LTTSFPDAGHRVPHFFMAKNRASARPRHGRALTNRADVDAARKEPSVLALQTDRLTLRRFQESDLAAFATYRSDPFVARYQSWTVPYTLDHAVTFLEEMASAPPGTPGRWFQLAVERRSHPGIIGDCGFQVSADDDRQAQIGFTFSRLFQKQGYATEAVRCVLDHLFDWRSLHRVTATCDVENQDSINLLERIGMRREAHLIENLWFRDAWGSEYSYALLRREWQRDRLF